MGHLSLPASEIQAMVNAEMEVVVRELTEEPASALMALTESRSCMDEMAIRAQVRVVVHECSPWTSLFPWIFLVHEGNARQYQVTRGIP